MTQEIDTLSYLFDVYAGNMKYIKYSEHAEDQGKADKHTDESALEHRLNAASLILLDLNKYLDIQNVLYIHIVARGVAIH